MKHEQMRIEHGDQSADVDTAMAPLILALWRRGLRTTGSCQRQDEHAWIAFDSLADAVTFHRMAGQSVARLVTVTDEDRARAEAAGEDTSGAAAVAFPYRELPAVVEQVERIAEPNEWLRGLARLTIAAQLAIPEPREEDR
ncbi:hypothetical protein BH23CHL10_BH23CHL10_13550 [soil metagenome]